MARFVLVHGAFAGAWLWEPVVDKLETAGHTVETLDLPGAGNDHTPVEEITLDAYAERICQVLGRRPQQAVLVGHSMGGMAVTQAASRCPERVAALIYVAAFLPGEGQSLKGLTELPEGEGDHVQKTMVVSGEPPIANMPSLQRRMMKERGVSPVIELDTDHTPQLSAPDELVTALDQLARHEVPA
jgi:pimeloyl-ACP methyl ester carboxylesterase